MHLYPPLPPLGRSCIVWGTDSIRGSGTAMKRCEQTDTHHCSTQSLKFIELSWRQSGDQRHGSSFFSTWCPGRRWQHGDFYFFNKTSSFMAWEKSYASKLHKPHKNLSTYLKKVIFTKQQGRFSSSYHEKLIFETHYLHSVCRKTDLCTPAFRQVMYATSTRPNAPKSYLSLL